MSEEQTLVPFEVKDCALVGIATGQRVQTLREMRDVLQSIHPECVYYHFWGHLLRPQFDDPEYKNDFATCAHRALHDRKLAEQLGVIDPAEFETLENLRQEVIGVIEERLDESDTMIWATADQQFHFIRSQIVVFNARVMLTQPDELAEITPNLSLGSIFYHVIDARRRQPKSTDDFSAWLQAAGDAYNDLCDQVADIDPYFATLSEIRQSLSDIFINYFGRKAK